MIVNFKGGPQNGLQASWDGESLFIRAGRIKDGIGYLDEYVVQKSDGKILTAEFCVSCALNARDQLTTKIAEVN